VLSASSLPLLPSSILVIAPILIHPVLLTPAIVSPLIASPIVIASPVIINEENNFAIYADNNTTEVQAETKKIKIKKNKNIFDDKKEPVTFGSPLRSPLRLSPTDSHPIKLCVVDDNDVNRKILDRMLKGFEGVHVCACSNGQDAVDLIFNAKQQGVPFDIAFMDLVMPVLGGIEATKQIREKGLTLPIFALTANAMSHDKDDCLEAGMNGHLSKPFTKHDIIQLLQVALNLNLKPRLLTSVLSSSSNVMTKNQQQCT